MDFLNFILTKFIFKKFWKNFLLIFIIFSGIYYLTDLISNLNLIFKYNTNFSYFIIYSIFKIPEGLKYIIPISVLTSSMYLFATLNKNFEIISFRALQINKKYIIIPLIISGFIISILSFIVNELILPKSNYYAKYFRTVKIERKTNFAVTKANNIWYYKKNYILRIKFLYFDSGIFNNMTILKFDKNFNLIERIDADYGYKKKGKWILVNPMIFKFKDGMVKDFHKSLTYPMPIKLDKSDFFVIEQGTRNLNLFSQLKLIKFLKKNHINPDKFIISIFDKIFYPFVSIIFILLGFFLNIRPAKSGTVLSIILAIFLGAGYFVLNGFFISLSKIKILPVFVGPSLTFFIYIGILFVINKKFSY